jgi:hypothetical protein
MIQSVDELDDDTIDRVSISISRKVHDTLVEHTRLN